MRFHQLRIDEIGGWENTLDGLPDGLPHLHFLGIQQQGSPDGLRHGGGRHRWGHSVVLATSSLEVKHKQRRVELIRGDLTACAACAAARAVLHGWFEPSDGGGDEDCGGLELAVRIN